LKKLDILPLNQWFNGELEFPVIISGPCSAESEFQIFETARQISHLKQIKIFRAGIWKPRTRPNTFEGEGENALKWLKNVKNSFHFLTTTEVATPKHIEECLLSEAVDILWLGARTVANPFSVQEIANSLRGVNIPVLVKNPIHPDISLWQGALERLNKNGIKCLAAIHRGFSPFEKSILRNIPKWELPIELKINFPDLPIFCDPSHIAGKVSYIETISQKALNLNFDGLMIETHFDPRNALSDAEQQLLPSELENLLQKLQFRNTTSENSDFKKRLEQYREQIDSVDLQLMELLSQRMKIVENIGIYKKQNNVTILQPSRWREILQTRTEWAKKLGLSENFVMQLLQIIHKESIEKQEK